MLRDSLYLDLYYDTSKGELSFNSNVTVNTLVGLITDFLMNQGMIVEDGKRHNNMEPYRIRLEMDPSEYVFRVTKDNTGSKMLRDDILIRCANMSLNAGMRQESQAHGMG